MNATGFTDRMEAGGELAQQLRGYAHQPGVIVLGLPRGGVPVAVEVAKALACPLDVLMVRKLGTPGQPELAMGAIASGGVRLINAEIVAAAGVSEQEIEAVARREQAEIERREQVYRALRPPLAVAGQTVILVDDGLATGATMRAGVEAVKRLGAKKVVVAVPVGARETCRALKAEVDELICLLQPQQFHAVGSWYDVFPQITDAEVRALLDA